MSKIRTAVFPIAGLGSRFLPITKAIPKEMLPIIDKPLIQFAVEEAVAAGIEKLIFVTCGGKRAVEDYFDNNFELETRLKQQGKLTQLSRVQDILPEHVSFSYVRQKSPRGLGDAILVAKDLVGDEPFAVLLADDLMFAPKQPVLQQLITVFNQHGHSVIAVESVPHTETHKYGIVKLDDKTQVQRIVEKPKPEEAPSNLAVVGRYVLTPDIFDHLAHIKLGVGNELQLTDAIAELLSEQPVYAHMFDGVRYDCGSVAGYLTAVLACAKQHDELVDVIQSAITKD